MKKLMKIVLALGLSIALVGCSKTEEKKEATLGETLVATFKETASKTATAEEIASKLIDSDAIVQQGMMAMPVEPGLLNGFDNEEITGFKEGTMFAPMIGSIPFVGYVFTLDEGTDANEFMKTLKDKCNTRWNVCTEADETVCENVDDKVVFIMCPTSFEEE